MLYYPTPENPFKWYKIVKNTNIKGFNVSEFWVCIYQYAITYYPYKTSVWFSQFVSMDNAITVYTEPLVEEPLVEEPPVEESPVEEPPVEPIKTPPLRIPNMSKFNDAKIDSWVYDFDGLVFEVDPDDTKGLTNQINEYLAIKYQVELTDIFE